LQKARRENQDTSSQKFSGDSSKTHHLKIMASSAHFGSLLKLLDDETVEVRQGVERALLDYEGDASDDLAALGIHLKSKEAQLLSTSLHAGRQKALKEQWAMPASHLRYPDSDHDLLESLLRLLSDFLHDGVTLRPSLSDELDILAREAETEVATPLELSAWLFLSGRFTGNKVAPFDPRNSDLAWCLEEDQSNPLGLSLIYLLVAHRLGLEVFGVNYPGHFLCLIDTSEGPTLIDAFHQGRPIVITKLLADHPELSEEACKAVRQPSSLAAILLRVLANMNLAFNKAGRFDDAEIMQDLMKTFRP
jgi:regulator of sirC expression with transglutaminase-like and TPR domain